MNLHLVKAVGACALILLTSLTHAIVLPLEGRLPETPGGSDYQAYYDPNLDITWAADADFIGGTEWSDAMSWASSVNIGGVTGWRLPHLGLPDDYGGEDCVVFDTCTMGEMGFLYWTEGITADDPGPFSDLRGWWYWHDDTNWTEHLLALGPYVFNFSTPENPGDARPGQWISTFYDSPLLAWAVHDGDVGKIPAPPVLWLVGSGLLCMMGISRKKPS